MEKVEKVEKVEEVEGVESGKSGKSGISGMNGAEARGKALSNRTRLWQGSVGVALAHAWAQAYHE